MYKLFRPTFLACPNCNKSKNHLSKQNIKSLTKADKNYICMSNQHKFSLFESLQYEACTIFSSEIYSHWKWYETVDILIGQLTSVIVPLPEDFNIFEISIHAMSDNKHEWTPFFPTVLHSDTQEIIISPSGIIKNDTNDLGVPGQVGLYVNAYQITKESLWVDLFYESLSDKHEGKYNLSIFKLISSIEIAYREVITKYFSFKNVPETISKKIIKEERGWPSKIDKLIDAANEFLPDYEFNALCAIRNEFITATNKYRNSFAHGSFAILDSDKTKQIFSICFPILWAIENITATLDNTATNPDHLKD